MDQLMTIGDHKTIVDQKFEVLVSSFFLVTLSHRVKAHKLTIIFNKQLLHFIHQITDVINICPVAPDLES
jgi:hypothetical protein